jgi:Flp pilus assembly pilin Flp
MGSDTQAVRKESKPDRGATLVEYALLVALIATVAVGGISILGKNVSQKFSVINQKTDRAMSS